MQKADSDGLDSERAQSGNRLFRRDVFLQWERQLIPATVEAALAPAVRAGRGDLVVLARRAMMAVAIATAGIDRPAGTEEELNDLYSILVRLSRASTIVHATGDRGAITAAGLEALSEFDARWYQPSVSREREERRERAVHEQARHRLFGEKPVAADRDLTA